MTTIMRVQTLVPYYEEFKRTLYEAIEKEAKKKGLTCATTLAVQEAIFNEKLWRLIVDEKLNSVQLVVQLQCEDSKGELVERTLLICIIRGEPLSKIAVSIY